MFQSNRVRQMVLIDIYNGWISPMYSGCRSERRVFVLKEPKKREIAAFLDILIVVN